MPNLTLEGTAEFVHLFEPHAMNEKAEPKYSLRLLFDVGYDYSQIMAAVQQAAVDKWGANIPQSYALPIVDTQTKEKMQGKDFYVGKWYMGCSNTRKVKVLDQAHQEIIDPSQMYSGCRVKVSVNIKAYDKMGNRGVTAYLNGVMKVADGERLDNTLSTEEMFGAPSAVPTPSATPQASAPYQMPAPGAPGNDNGFMPTPAQMNVAAPSAPPAAATTPAPAPAPSAAPAPAGAPVAPATPSAGAPAAAASPSNVPTAAPGAALPINPATGLPYGQ